MRDSFFCLPCVRMTENMTDKFFSMNFYEKLSLISAVICLARFLTIKEQNSSEFHNV